MHALDYSAWQCGASEHQEDEEIRTGKVRHFKARMCIVAQEPGQMQTLVADDHVLFWFKNCFYRANHFAAAYAVLPIQDRFEVLSDANTTFQPLALTKQDMRTSSAMCTTSFGLPPKLLIRKAEADPSLRPRRTRITPGLPGRIRFSSRSNSRYTHNRSGTISTTSGPIRSGRIDVVETKAISQYRDRRYGQSYR